MSTNTHNKYNTYQPYAQYIIRDVETEKFHDFLDSIIKSKLVLFVYK